MVWRSMGGRPAAGRRKDPRREQVFTSEQQFISPTIGVFRLVGRVFR